MGAAHGGAGRGERRLCAWPACDLGPPAESPLCTDLPAASAEPLPHRPQLPHLVLKTAGLRQAAADVLETLASASVNKDVKRHSDCQRCSLHIPLRLFDVSIVFLSRCTSWELDMYLYLFMGMKNCCVNVECFKRLHSYEARGRNRVLTITGFSSFLSDLETQRQRRRRDAVARVARLHPIWGLLQLWWNRWASLRPVQPRPSA